jgi:glycosyltransferase involved in cell wall biosynthesis
MKVLHVINSLNVGGAETILANTFDEGGLQSYTENVVVFFGGSDRLAHKIDSSVKVINLKYKGYLGLPLLFLQLRKIIKKHHIDIIHTHLVPASFYTFICKPQKIPQVHTLHTTYSLDRENKKSFLWLEKKIFLENKKCNLILLTNFIKEDFFKVVKFKGKAFVLGNFANPSFFQNEKKHEIESNKPIKAIAIGRLSAVKNYKYLIEVFAQLKNIDITLDIYGDGKADEYEELINTSKSKVKMMGANANLSEVIQQYDVFFMSSLFEGFPISILEAMATGLPCILSDIAPLKNLFHKKAMFFTLNNEEEAANQITSYLTNTAALNLFAKEGSLFAQKEGTREMYISKLLSIYKSILGSKD